MKNSFGGKQLLFVLKQKSIEEAAETTRRTPKLGQKQSCIHSEQLEHMLFPIRSHSTRGSCIKYIDSDIYLAHLTEKDQPHASKQNKTINKSDKSLRATERV